MKQETNAFGERICMKERCPAYYYSEDYGELCGARLDYTGRIKAVDGKAQYGKLCTLPIGFKVVVDKE